MVFLMLPKRGEYGRSAASFSVSIPVSMRFLTELRACHSEIGLKWFLFVFHSLRMVLGFVYVLDISKQLSSRHWPKCSKKELWPFLTILGTPMRAKIPITQGQVASSRILLSNTRALSSFDEQLKTGL